MGKISKYSNIYDIKNNLVRHVDENGVLRNYTLEELDELCKTLTPGTKEYENSVRILLDWYQHPRTKEDAEYVKKKQQELIDKLQKQAEENKKSSSEKVAEALNEVKNEVEPQYDGSDLSKEEYVEPVESVENERKTTKSDANDGTVGNGEEAAA